MERWPALWEVVGSVPREKIVDIATLFKTRDLKFFGKILFVPHMSTAHRQPAHSFNRFAPKPFVAARADPRPFYRL